MELSSKTNPDFWCLDCQKHFDKIKSRQNHTREGRQKCDWELQCWSCSDGQLFSTTSNAYRHMRKYHTEECFELYDETKKWETLADLMKQRGFSSPEVETSDLNHVISLRFWTVKRLLTKCYRAVPSVGTLFAKIKLRSPVSCDFHGRQIQWVQSLGYADFDLTS